MQEPLKGGSFADMMRMRTSTLDFVGKWSDQFFFLTYAQKRNCKTAATDAKSAGMQEEKHFSLPGDTILGN